MIEGARVWVGPRLHRRKLKVRLVVPDRQLSPTEMSAIRHGVRVAPYFPDEVRRELSVEHETGCGNVFVGWPDGEIEKRPDDELDAIADRIVLETLDGTLPGA